MADMATYPGVLPQNLARKDPGKCWIWRKCMIQDIQVQPPTSKKRLCGQTQQWFCLPSIHDPTISLLATVPCGTCPPQLLSQFMCFGWQIDFTPRTCDLGLTHHHQCLEQCLALCSLCTSSRWINERKWIHSSDHRACFRNGHRPKF